MIVVVLVVVLSIDLCISTGGGNEKVTFTSSPDPPNIAEGNTAVFNCSSSHSLVFINWILNNVSASSLGLSVEVTQTVDETGKTVSSLIIPGQVDPFNGTEISCYVSGPSINNDNSSPLTLRIQGRLGLVDELDEVQSHFSWTPPFTLSGVPILRYNINVTNDTELIKQTDVRETEWKYCPQQFGNLSISVAAVNDAGEGNISYYHLPVEEIDEINGTELIDQYLDDSQNHIICINVPRKEKLNAKFKNCKFNYVVLDCIDNNAIFNSSNINDNGFVIFNITAADKFHEVTTHIIFESGLVVNSNSSNPLSLSFFDVSGYKVPSRVSTNVSFQCTFLKGSKAIGCHIIIEEMTTGRNYSLNITRENITATGRVEEFVETGSYNVSIYDINFDGNQASEPAYYTTIVVASGNSTPSPTASSSPTVITSPTSMLSTTPSPTTGEASNDNNGVIPIVIGSIFGIIFFGIILIVLVAFVCWKHKTHSQEYEISKRASQDVSNVEPSQNVSNVEPSQDVSNVEPKNTVNYVDVERPGSNAPANPPPLEISKTVYSTILPTNNQTQHDEEYSQTGSMLYDTVTDRPIQAVTVPSQYSVVSKEHIC